VLAERGKNGASVATVVGEEETPKTPVKAKARKPAAKKAVVKKKKK